MAVEAPYKVAMQSSTAAARWIPCVAGLVLMTDASVGQVVLSPVAVVDTDLGSFSDSVSVTNMINQSGITTPFVSGVTVFDTYFANPSQPYATSGSGGVNNWQSVLSFNLPLRGYVDFDLGAVYQINKLAIWNRSLKDITIRILDDLSGPEQVAGSFVLTSQLSASFSYLPEVLSFAAPLQGRYVRLVIDSVHTFSPADTFGYAIVGEVVLSAVPVGPPPPDISVVHEPNGDVKVTFTGVLQAAETIDGSFEDLEAAPASPFTLPKAGLLTQRFFRARAD